MKTEIWKDIKDYEGLYQVSNLGNVKSLGKGTSRNSKVRIMKKTITKDGYHRVCLTKNFREKTIKVHRLVAQAFIPNPENKPQVNHINGIKTDNKAENLEWCTASENIKHNHNKLGYKNNFQTNHYNKKKVLQKKGDTVIKIWESVIDIINLYDFNRNTFYSVLNKNKSNHYKGYNWEYK